MADAYATRHHFYAFGARRGLVDDERRLVEVDPSTNRVVLANHALLLNDPHEFVVEGSATDVLPAPLAATLVYYARPVEGSTSLFEVAAEPDGPAIELLDAGTGDFGIVVDLGPEIDLALESYSRFIDNMMPAHAVPFTAPYPLWLTEAVAVLAARAVLGRRELLYPELDAQAERVAAELRIRRKGMLRSRDKRATRSTNRAVTLGAVLSTPADPVIH